MPKVANIDAALRLLEHHRKELKKLQAQGRPSRWRQCLVEIIEEYCEKHAGEGIWSK